MRLGTAAHTAVLEPERFRREFAVWGERDDAGNMRPRRGKLWDGFKVLPVNAGKTVITLDELELVEGIQAAVRNNPIAAQYLESGDPEVTMQWMLDRRECRGRVDWLRLTDPVIVGLKTARDCRHFTFSSAAARLGYHLQWAFYYDGYKAITGHIPKMAEIVVESAPPHAVAVYTIPDDIIEQGRDEYKALIRKLEECEAIGYFPGPQEEEEPITLPSWAYPSGEDDLSDLELET
jgi:hypothetical protein